MVKILESHVKQVCAAIVRDPHWREEAEQNAWLRIVEIAQKQFVSIPLARTIARRKCYDLFRYEAHRTHEEFHPESDAPAIEPDTPLNLDVEEYLLSLDGPCRTVLDHVLHENHGTTRDIAEHAGCSQRTVVRVLGAFRTYLEERMQ